MFSSIISLDSSNTCCDYRDRLQNKENSIRRDNHFSASVSEYYSSSSFSFSCRNEDGDSISISLNEQQYRRSTAMVDESGGASREQRDELVFYLKEEIASQEKWLIEITLGARRGGADEEVTDDKDPLENLPEYWNAENTSQRIVDFALSFSSLHDGAPREYLSMIRDAIDEGFRQAREIFGELPTAVAGLVDDTYNKVMEKLEAWEANHQAQSNDTEKEAA